MVLYRPITTPPFCTPATCLGRLPRSPPAGRPLRCHVTRGNRRRQPTQRCGPAAAGYCAVGAARHSRFVARRATRRPFWFRRPASSTEGCRGCEDGAARRRRSATCVMGANQADPVDNRGRGGGHTTWTCRVCDETVFGPPLIYAAVAALLTAGRPADIALTDITKNNVRAASGVPTHHLSGRPPNAANGTEPHSKSIRAGGTRISEHQLDRGES